jgi:DNA-binding MarR family transcriptional regulator
MDNEKLLELVERYEELSFLIQKKGEYLTNKEINDELTYDQHFTLRYIMKKELCTSTDLAQEFHVKKSAITALINRLVDKGLVSRERNQDDRRVVYLHVTQKGKEFYDACNLKIHDIVSQFISHFSEKEIDSFMKTYEKLATLMDQIIKNNTEM